MNIHPYRHSLAANTISYSGSAFSRNKGSRVSKFAGTKTSHHEGSLPFASARLVICTYYMYVTATNMKVIDPLFSTLTCLFGHLSKLSFPKEIGNSLFSSYRISLLFKLLAYGGCIAQVVWYMWLVPGVRYLIHWVRSLLGRG